MERKEYGGQDRWMSVSVVAVLVFTAFFAVVSTQMPTAKAYNTPGSGVVWSMDDLVANSMGAVTGGGGVYDINEDLIILATDTVYMRVGELVSVDAGFGIYVEGTFLSQTPLGTVEFGSSLPSPEPQDWAGFTFFPRSIGRFDNIIIRHASTGVGINDADVTIRNSKLELNYPFGIFFNSGLFQLNNSVILGSPPPSVSITNDGGTAIFAMGAISDTLWLNESVIIGGNGTDSGFGGVAIFTQNLDGPTGIIGNRMIVGGRGGDNSIDAGTAGSGSMAIHFFPVFNSDSPPAINISGNAMIRGGRGGNNNASVDGSSGMGGVGIIITDTESQGSVVISDNQYISGGGGGRNRANWSGGFWVGNGGYGIVLSNVGGLSSSISNNQAIYGGDGGNNRGAAMVAGTSAGWGGHAVSMINVRNITVNVNTIVGGHGGNNTIPGVGVIAGTGGIGLLVGGSINMTITASSIYGGEGGDDFVGMVGPGMMAGPGNGNHAISSQNTLGVVNSCFVQGGKGGDNYGMFGEGRPGGYGVSLDGPFSLSFDGGTLIGGKGGDNYNDTGIASGSGSYAFYLNDAMRASVSNADIIGGAGGDSYFGANTMPGSGSGSVIILGASRAVTFSDNPLITIGAGGINFVTGAVGPKGGPVMEVGVNPQNVDIVRNFIYNGSGAGIYNQAPGLLVDGNIIENNLYGVLLESSANWANIINNQRIGEAQDGISIWGANNVLTRDNFIDNVDVGIRIDNSTDVLVDRTVINNTQSWGIVLQPFSERVLIENSSITNSVGRDIFLSLSNATTLNSTFDGTNVGVSPSSNLTVKNYLDVKVIDGVMAPIPNADVEVLDNGGQVYATPWYGGGNATTDASGEVNWIIVTDRIYIGSSIATDNATDAEVTEVGTVFFNNPRIVDMSVSHQEVFAEVMADNLPPRIYNVYLNGMKFVNVLAGTPVDITAILDDTTTGNSNITSANYTIGQDMWPGTPMNPTDGAFDGPVESADETIDTTPWSPGTYEIWVYGCDDQLNCNVTGDFATLNITTDTEPPRIQNVRVNGAISINVVQGTMVDITARVNDAPTGNSNILNANYTIRQDIWPTSTPMNPTDGAFDSQSEDVNETIDTTGWVPGTYEIWVYGCDIVPNCNITGDFATINIVLESLPPEIHNVTVNGLPSVDVVAGDLVILNATVNDTLTGESVIDGANYTIGFQNWTSSTPMFPADMWFDTMVEDVTAFVDTTNWGCGIYDLYVYGWDVIPNYNTTSVAYATINVTVCDFEPPEIYNVNIDGAATQTYYLSLLPATVTLTADIDDTLTGMSPIGGANYTIPADNWPSSVPMNPADGAFDTTFEVATATIATPANPGIYEYCVYAWDQVIPPNYNTTGDCAYLTIVDDLSPDVTNVLLNGSASASVVIGAIVTLTATADDTLRGGSDIQTVNYTIGKDAWLTSTPMDPTDGAFDNPMEDANITINTTALGLGTFTICVNVMDELRNENNTCIESATLDVTADDNLPPEISIVLVDGQAIKDATEGMVLVITATVNDIPTGGSNIKSANYTIGLMSFPGTPMSAQDVTFDSPTEDVIGLVDTAGWSVGISLVCVYGSDVASNNNTTSSACAQINIVVDVFPPTVTGSPRGVGVPIDTNITLNFNEPMNTDTVNMSFSYTDLTTTLNETHGTITWSNNNRTMTFDPAVDLDYSTTYIVTLNGSIAEDEVGNLLDGNRDGTGGDDYVFAFKTEEEPPVVDTIPPEVTDTDPNDGQTDIPVTIRVIKVTFNESMDEDKGDVTIDGIDTTESWDGNTLIITLMSDLEPDTTYEVRIRNAEDEAGNPLGEYTFTFTTGTEPVTPPPPGVAGFDWLWLLVIILVAIVVILGLMLMRKKRPEEVLVTPIAEEEVEAEIPVEEEEAPPPPEEEVLAEEEEGEFLEEADT
ncbi:MAG: hypothetical protein E3J35_00625 [Methanomassiliicoccales archaeon]|nr:MAG: hypothetical protein E3J35_00625 [Methanomassiliicoccales archaeon]